MGVLWVIWDGLCVSRIFVYFNSILESLDKKTTVWRTLVKSPKTFSSVAGNFGCNRRSAQLLATRLKKIWVVPPNRWDCCFSIVLCFQNYQFSEGIPGMSHFRRDLFFLGDDEYQWKSNTFEVCSCFFQTGYPRKYRHSIQNTSNRNIYIYTLNVYIKIGARPPVLRRKHDLNNFRKEIKIRFHEEKISPTNGTFSSKKCLLRNCLLGSSGGPGEGCSHWACIWRQSQVNFVTK